MSGFELGTDLVAFSLLLNEVGLDLFLVVQVVTQDRVNVRKSKRRILVDDFLSCGPTLERVNDRIEGYAGAANPNAPSVNALERNWF